MPTPNAATEAISTAPAAVSLATLASGWYWSVYKSVSASTTVLKASAVSTSPIAAAMQAQSTALIRRTSPAVIAHAAATRWTRMFRWDRTACQTPCQAKEKLRQNPDRVAVQGRRALSPPRPGGLMLIPFVFPAVSSRP